MRIIGGYAPPPVDDAPKTRAEADAQNKVGQENRERVRLSGYEGQSSEQLNAVNQRTQQEQQQRQQEQNNQQVQRQQMAIAAARASDMMRQAGYNVATGNEVYAGIMGETPQLATPNSYGTTRPGYTDPSTLGDTTTRQIQFMTDTQRMVFGQMGIVIPSSDIMLGRTLEGQRQAARSTPGLTDDRYYQNELQKWGQNKVEVSEGYHEWALATGKPQAANRYEYQGDLAVEFLKGAPGKSSEWFSPVSGEMAQYLPGGEGLQEYAWRSAVAYDKGYAEPAPVSFMEGVMYLGSREGMYGPYGSLYGGIQDEEVWVPPTAKEIAGTSFYDESGAKRPFVSAMVGVSNKDWNPFVVSAAEPTGFISEGIQIPNTTPPQETTWLSGFEGFQKSISNKAYSLYGSLFGASEEQTKKYVGNTAIIFETMANKNPVLLPIAYGTGAIKETFDQPVKAAVMYGVGFGTGAAFRGLTGASSLAVEAAGPQFPKAAKAFTIITKSAPYVLGGLYAADVGIRATEQGKDLGAGSIASNLGGISVTEIVPMTVGFAGGYKSPELIRGGYNYAKTIPEKYTTFKDSIPTKDQLYYKYIELKTPSTAMNQPMVSERFIKPRTPGSGKSSSFIESQRIAQRSSGTRGFGERGTVSDKPTPRQESLKLNYNPTATLTEWNPIKPKGFMQGKGGIGGIRGTLSGKWDVATTAEDPFAGLPLKEKWKMREAAIASTKGNRGGASYGGITGGLQSGMGEGGSTVRGGRQYLDIRMPSSGIATQESSLAPQRLEIIPSRQTAQRSRAFDTDFEYQSRKLPEGMVRPGSNQELSTLSLQTPVTEEFVIPALVSGTVLDLMQKSRENWVQDKVNEQRITIKPEQTIRQDERQRQEPILVPMLGTTQIPARIPRTEQIIVPVQDTTLITLPRIPSKQIPGTPNVDRPWIETPIPRPNIPETIRRPPTDIGTPFIPGLPIFPGASGATGTKRRGRQFRELFPLGLDISSQTAFGSTKRPHAKRKKGKLIAKRLGK